MLQNIQMLLPERGILLGSKVHMEGWNLSMGEQMEQLQMKFHGEVLANGAVELYYDNSKKFETSSTGASVNGDLYLGDGSEIHLGNSADLRIYHNGSHSYIADEGSGGINSFW